MRTLSAVTVLSGVALVLSGCGGGGTSKISIHAGAHDLGNYVSSESGPPTGTGGGSSDGGGVIVDNPDFAITGTGSNCGSVSSTGDCSGTVAEYCDSSSGHVVSMDCATQGRVCTIDGSGQPGCTTSGSGGGGGSCGNIDSNGICNGDVLEYCVGTLVTTDCSASGLICYVDSSGYADCY